VTPLILALDTTQEHGSIALVRGAETIAELAIHSPDGFAHAIYGHLEAILRRYAIGLREIDVFAAASGPGSFTGVRVGLASIKGLAEAMGKPAAGISNLRAIASFGTAPLRAPVLDARRGEVYAAIYDAAGVLVQQETVGKFESWLAALPESGIEILSPDYAAEGVPIVRTPRELAAAVARLAPAEAGDPAALDANYVRRSDAELFWKEW
jgi:tRNA threonylcarbamoyladenosine biosynthesis protein TsaB